MDCGNTLEPPRRGGSNEYPQSMFLSKNKQSRYTSANPIFFYIKVGFKGVYSTRVYITRTCFHDENPPTSFVFGLGKIKKLYLSIKSQDNV